MDERFGPLVNPTTGFDIWRNPRPPPHHAAIRCMRDYRLEGAAPNWANTSWAKLRPLAEQKAV